MTSFDRRRFHRTLLAVPVAALVGTGLGALAPAAASAAPADWNAQFLVGQANGELMRRMRAGDGTWQPSWYKVATPNTTYRVSCAGISKDLHIVAAIGNGAPLYGVRNGMDGSWRDFHAIPSLSGPTVGAPHVAVASLGSALHVFGASERGTDLFHTVRNEDGSWSNSWKLLRTFGQISHIATARVGTTIDTAVVTGGEIYHAIRASDGTWSNWGNIEGAAGEIGNVYEVALAGFGAQLQVVALTTSNELFHAIRYGDGSWQRFRKMTAFSDYTPFGISAANVGGELQFACIVLSSTGQIIKHTIRRSDGTWTLVRNVSLTGLTDDPGVLALAGTTI
jgi:hypothetical protein